MAKAVGLTKVSIRNSIRDLGEPKRIYSLIIQLNYFK
jgi:hypothetical protein